jgi:hypothetical protein
LSYENTASLASGKSTSGGTVTGRSGKLSLRYVALAASACSYEVTTDRIF